MMVRACVRSCVCKPNRDRKGAGPPRSMAASLRARFGEHRFHTRSQKIIETRDGSGNMVQQFIHGTHYIDELTADALGPEG